MKITGDIPITITLLEVNNFSSIINDVNVKIFNDDDKINPEFAASLMGERIYLKSDPNML